MKVLIIYAQGTRKIKQVYTVDEANVEPIGGAGENGYPLIFYPEGRKSSIFISQSQLDSVKLGRPIEGHQCMIYPL